MDIQFNDVPGVLNDATMEMVANKRPNKKASKKGPAMFELSLRCTV